MSRESAILQLMHTPGIGAKRLNRLLKKLELEKYQVDDFVKAPASDLTLEYKFTESMVTSLKSDTDKSEEILEELLKHDVHILSLTDSSYPSQLYDILVEDAPPVLFIKGNLNVLSKHGVGICGSRKASENGIQLIRGASGEFAKRNINIISGYANGIDLAAHLGSLEQGGVTTFVLPLGILNLQVKGALTELISENNYLVMSEFIPRIGWEIHNAMRRNLTICGLSKAIILVEPGLKGGTFEAGKAAIKYNRPLFVVEHEAQLDQEGNKYFVQRGAKSLHENSDGTLDLKSVFESLVTENSIVKQQTLF